MLYGYLTLDIKAMTAGSAIANPILRPAIPQAFESVWSTIRLGYLLTKDVSEGLTEKSM